MPLIQLWEQTPGIVLQYNIKQIVSSAGDGILADHSECVEELRYFLSNIPTEKLVEHMEYCLCNSFEKSGFVLQDIVNELGRRLDYDVEYGLYQGRSDKIGCDGIWQTSDGYSLVTESKTTDAYRINLDTLATYRTKLIEAGRITEQSSILIIVGRNDTGDLEAQIRGSRHAWDTRIISMDALAKLVELKVGSDEEETTEKIRGLLVPFEYTRLDNIIDVVFTTAKDVESAAEEDDLSEGNGAVTERESHKQNPTPRAILEKVRSNALNALSKREGISLIAHKRLQFWSADKNVRAVCPVSKLYDRGGYWYAFHPHQKDFLSEADRSFLILGCVDSAVAYAIPYDKMEELAPHLHTTDKGGRSYWHIHLQPSNDDSFELIVPRDNENLDLKPYELPIEPSEQ